MELVVSDGSNNTGWTPAQSSNPPSMAICLKLPAPTLTERVNHNPTPNGVILEVFIIQFDSTAHRLGQGAESVRSREGPIERVIHRIRREGTAWRDKNPKLSFLLAVCRPGIGRSH